MKTKHFIIIGVMITFTIIFFVLGPSQGHIAEYFLTDEQFQDMILDNNFYVIDSRNTQNPNECWYQEDDGVMMPCKINSTGPSMVIGMGLIIFWPYIVLVIVIGIIFIIWRKRK